MQTLEKFLARTDVKLRCQEVTLTGDERLSVFDPWATKHYVCELRGSNGDRPIRAVIGSDDGPPEITEVLDLLAAESAVADQAATFETWAAEMGYDGDSRRDERTYRSLRRQARSLRRLLGEDAYRRLLWETERL